MMEGSMLWFLMSVHNYHSLAMHIVEIKKTYGWYPDLVLSPALVIVSVESSAKPVPANIKTSSNNSPEKTSTAIVRGPIWQTS